MARTRILVVDDSVVARKLISDIIEEEADFTVVGTAAHGRIALAGLSEDIQDIMAVTGFLNHFTTCKTVDAGVKALISQ